MQKPITHSGPTAISHPDQRSRYEFGHGEHGWYFCWLIERRRPNNAPDWWTAHGTWTTDANNALWFARKRDADIAELLVPRDSGSVQGARVVCEHGFALG